MKRFVLGMMAAVALLAGCGTTAPEDAVTVQSVSMIVNDGSVGMVSRYAGVVVSGQTAEIKKEDNKTVGEVFVEEGDWVNEGDILFTYDMEALELELTKKQLELEGYANTIQTAQDEIPQLEKQRASAGADQQLSYTLQIQSLQADIREAEYNHALKEREIAIMEASMAETEVRSPLSGRVMGVTDENEQNYSGEPSAAYITLMDMTTYRVEGNINEMNIGTLMEGMDVLIRSRVDESVVWSGTLESIDWENPVSGNDNQMYYYGAADEMTSSSKYPFYVVLEDVTGLILGQHVYIEPNYGQMEIREGLWIPEYYIVDAAENPAVWVANGRNKLEKRSIRLGEYDMEMCEYQILSGLTEEDYIAFPDETLTGGMSVVRYDENSFGGEDYASSGNASMAVYASAANAVMVVG